MPWRIPDLACTSRKAARSAAYDAEVVWQASWHCSTSRPPNEQRRIADFLDAETARIDDADQRTRQASTLLIERDVR